MLGAVALLSALAWCRPDGALTGAWRNSRMTSLGPVRAHVAFTADCKYRMALNGLFFRIREEGAFRVENDAIVFSRENGSETRWPYRIEGGRLVLQESPKESWTYDRVK